MRFHLLIPLAVLVPTACTAQPRCVEIVTEATADLGFPIVLLIGEEPTVGGGAFPAPANVGEQAGMLAPIVTRQETDREGVARFTLVHHFEAASGDALWTEDEAACTPVPGGDLCDVTTEMRVVGGRAISPAPAAPSATKVGSP